jgi:hypothetical protein
MLLYDILNIDVHFTGATHGHFMVSMQHESDQSALPLRALELGAVILISYSMTWMLVAQILTPVHLFPYSS